MPILLQTPDYLIETDRYPSKGTLLTIVRRKDGAGVFLIGKGLAKGVKEALAKYGPERTLSSYLRATANQEWQRCYKGPV